MTTSANNEGQDEIVNNLAASTSRLHQLKLEHDPATPDVISSASEGEEGDDPGVYVVAQGSHKDASTVETAGGQRREPFASTSAYLPATGPVVHADASAIQSSDPASQPQSEAGTSRNGEETFIFGASTRLGGRILYEGRDPWTHNAWDNVAWDEEQQEAATKAIEKQRSAPIDPEEQERLNAKPERYWDLFYKNVEDTFFKDRSWLCQEFEALNDSLKSNAGPRRVCEIGCGTGATAYPLLAKNENPDFFIHCLDFSPRAVQLVQDNPAYDTSKICGEVWSVCDPKGLSPAVKPGSIDVATLIFCLSALHPSEWKNAMKNIWTMLKPGGVVCFRDYGRNDLTQLRFKGSRYMEDNLYARGDKTRVYFFEKDELEEIFSPKSSQQDEGQATYQFETVKLGVDRRLLMNRKRKLKMYRVWMQGIFRKPLES